MLLRYGKRLDGEPMRILLVLTLLWTPFATAQERILGLVEIPSLPDFKTRLSETPGVILREGPLANSALAAEVRSLSELKFREHLYGARSAVVYKIEHTDDATWYQVRLASTDRPGWISAETTGAFHSAVELINHGLAVLTPSWDKRLRLNYGKSETEFVAPLGGAEYPVSIAETAIVNGDPWFLVVVTDGICGDGELTVLSAGWVPLYAANGSLNLWYYNDC